MHSVAPGRVITMPSHEEHILRILGEATDPLFPSEIAERLNRELGPSGCVHKPGDRGSLEPCE
jgi:hypothetical protein